MVSRKAWLIGLQTFNGVTAAAGGIALMSGTIKMPQWIAHTGFSSLYFPGVILMAIVGGSALLAAISLYKQATGAYLASLLAGVIMLFWIIGEITSIRTFHVLQAIYLITALAVIVLTPQAKLTITNYQNCSRGVK